MTKQPRLCIHKYCRRFFRRILPSKQATVAVSRDQQTEENPLQSPSGPRLRSVLSQKPLNVHEIMVLTLYHLDASPPCRPIRWLASALGLDLQLKTVDLLTGEHLQPEFRQKTPAHQVPILEDDGIYLAESRAILGYLVDKYSKDDSLYPKDALKRAIVNQRLHFDLGTLWQRYHDYYLPYHMYDKDDNEKLVKLDDAFSVFNEIMSNQKYAAGNEITIADYALAVTVSSAEFSGYKVDTYPNVKRWLDVVSKEIPTFNEVNSQSFESLRKLYEFVRSKR